MTHSLSHRGGTWLFRREDVPVREKCLWRLLYETAARAQEVLSLNVEDVDLGNKRARTTSKGGDTEWLHFQSGSARLLPRIIAGRQTGPLFLADRRPAPARTPATVDVCPVTGRGRLSYERAEYLVPPARTVADAADAFLARATATTTRRSYGQTMSALTAAYGDRPLEALDGPLATAEHGERAQRGDVPVPGGRRQRPPAVRGELYDGRSSDVSATALVRSVFSGRRSRPTQRSTCSQPLVLFAAPPPELSDLVTGGYSVPVGGHPAVLERMRLVSTSSLASDRRDPAPIRFRRATLSC